MRIGVEHHLIDATGRYHLLVNDGADVKLLGHRYVVHVIDEGYGLANAHSLGGKTGENVCLCLGGKSTESVHVGESFVEE